MSNSQSRKTEKTISARTTPDEAQAIAEKAAQHGLSSGQYMKSLALRDTGKSLPVLRKRPPGDAGLLREIIGLIGKTHGILNQIAVVANSTGSIRKRELIEEALDELRQIRQMLAAALGVRDP